MTSHRRPQGLDRSPREVPSAANDAHAAELISEFLDSKGWSTLRLALETEIQAKAHDRADLTVSRRTLDRVVCEGHVPRSRAKAGIVLAMNAHREDGSPPLAPWQIWGQAQMPLAWQRALAGVAR